MAGKTGSALYRTATGVVVVDTAPVANTTAGKWLVGSQCSRKPVLVGNGTGQTVYVLVNRTRAEVVAGTKPAAAVTAFTFVVANGQTVDVSVGGMVNVEYLSVWVPTGGVVGQLQITAFE